MKDGGQTTRLPAQTTVLVLVHEQISTQRDSFRSKKKARKKAWQIVVNFEYILRRMKIQETKTREG